MVPIFPLFWVFHAARGEQYLGWVCKPSGGGCRQLSGEYRFKSARPALLLERPMGSSTRRASLRGPGFLRRAAAELLPGLPCHRAPSLALQAVMHPGRGQREGHPHGDRGPPSPSAGTSISALGNEALIYTLPLPPCAVCHLHGINSCPSSARALPPLPGIPARHADPLR